MKLLVGLVGLLAGTAHAHNWLEAPPSYNANKAATTAPCPAKAAGYTAMNVQQNAAVTYKWTTNHAGNHWIKVVAKADAANLESIKEGDPKMVFYQSYAVGTATGPVAIAAAGEFVVQYGWSNYRNCVDVVVAASAPALPADGTPCVPGACPIISGQYSVCNTATGVCDCKAGPYIKNTDGVCIDPTDQSSADCENYCKDALTGCTGLNQLFATREGCLATCATYPMGKPGDHTGNSLQCRYYHLHAEGASATHCPHASKEGGGKCTGGDFLPGASITVIGTASLTDVALKSLIEGAIAAQGLTNQVVVTMVVPAEQAGEYTVFFQFNDTGAEGGKTPEALAAEFTAGGGSAEAIKAAVSADANVSSIKVNSSAGESTDLNTAHSNAVPASVALAAFVGLSLLF